ncbi:MAG: type II toxin-antitoxin system VapC family toxin [Anaerolineae bacterium]
MNSWVCVDANLVLKLVLREADSNKANFLWQSWLEQGYRPVAPYLFPMEITAVLRNHVYRGVISASYGRTALDTALAFSVTLLTFSNLSQLAWQLAEKLNRPTAYDAHYLALAEMLHCDFWTADRRLYNAAAATLPWVHSLDEIPEQ